MLCWMDEVSVNRAYAVDIAPVVLSLGVNERLAIHLMWQV